MEILYVVPYVPNLIRVRPYQLIRALLRRGHRLTVATLWTSAQECADLQPLADAGARIVAQEQPRWRSLLNTLQAVPTAVPLQAVYSWQQALARTLTTSCQQTSFDVVQVEHLRGARYGLQLKRWAAQQPMALPVIWDSVDCITHLFSQAAQHSSSRQSRLLTQFELRRTRAYEGWLVNQFDQVLVTSPADQRALATLAQTQMSTVAKQRNTAGAASAASSPVLLPDNLHVLPNGVDLDYFCPSAAPRDAATLVFSGKLSYHANITAALYLVQEIMPLVWAQQPAVQLYLVGKDPPPALRALTAQAGTHAGKPRVVVTGTVADLRPYLQRATIAVAPLLYGAGIQNKVLEALACGAPVITTPQATAALATAAAQALVVAATAPAFAQAILTLLADPDQQRTLGQRGRAYVERYHAWDVMAAQLEHIYTAAIGERKPAR